MRGTSELGIGCIRLQYLFRIHESLGINNYDPLDCLYTPTHNCILYD